jgi:hypothetical protein
MKRECKTTDALETMVFQIVKTIVPCFVSGNGRLAFPEKLSHGKQTKNPKMLEK